MEDQRGTSHVYGIDRHTLCLASLPSHSASQSLFALGTLGVHDPGEVHVVNLNTDEDQTLHSTVHKHTTGIRSLSAAWSEQELMLVTTDGAIELVSLSDQKETRQLAKLDHHGKASRVLCHQQAKHAAVIATGVTVWDMTQLTSMHTLPVDDVETAAWHPTTTGLATSDTHGGLRTWDLRTATVSIECAHAGRIRALDYNPNLPHHLASGGSDGILRIWDLRNPNSPLLTAANHTHWICALHYNPSHDQLLLSAGSDALVNLESAVSLSSACAADTHSDDSTRPTDGLVMQYDDHESSVYAVQWSANDPWVFASLSFDGRLVINTVPREEKYKILL
ncbi:Protein tssc1 [Coemansia sp. RSA 2675]|nr:Protein tssc1 [Coemansia sp. RSA 2675]